MIIKMVIELFLSMLFGALLALIGGWKILSIVPVWLIYSVVTSVVLTSFIVNNLKEK